jgi:hypothetical protein
VRILAKPDELAGTGDGASRSKRKLFGEMLGRIWALPLFPAVNAKIEGPDLSAKAARSEQCLRKWLQSSKGGSSDGKTGLSERASRLGAGFPRQLSCRPQGCTMAAPEPKIGNSGSKTIRHAPSVSGHEIPIHLRHL